MLYHRRCSGMGGGGGRQFDWRRERGKVRWTTGLGKARVRKVEVVREELWNVVE